jgi:hypothetical protein
VLPVDDDELTRARHAPAHERAAARQHVDLARELAASVQHDALLAAHERAQDLELAREHDEEGGRAIADLEDDVASRELAAHADVGDALDLRLRQRGEHAIATLGRISHGISSRCARRRDRPVTLDGQARGLPVDQAARVVAQVAVALLAQVRDRGDAGVAVEIRAVHDDVVVLPEPFDVAAVRAEVDRPRDVLRAKSEVARRHDELERRAARAHGPQLVA